MRTPTIDILTGAQRRTSGTVSVLGRDPQNDEREWRAQVGVVPQGTAKYSDLTVREIIDHFATFYPDPFPTGQLIDMVGLRAKTKTYTTKLSGGQRRRLDEAQELSQRIGVIEGGRMLHVGTLDQFAQLTGSRRRVSYDLDPLVEVPPGLATRLESEPHTCLYATDEPTALLRLLLDAAQRRGISEIPGLQVTQPSLVAASLARSRVELLTFFRNWMSLIFNMALPVLLMLVFGAVFNQKIPGTNVDYRLLFISGMIGVGVMSTTFQSLALSVTSDRDEGLIRRLAAGNGALRPSDAFRRRALADLGVGGPARGEFLFAARYRLHGADSQFPSSPRCRHPSVHDSSVRFGGVLPALDDSRRAHQHRLRLPPAVDGEGPAVRVPAGILGVSRAERILGSGPGGDRLDCLDRGGWHSGCLRLLLARPAGEVKPVRRPT